MNPKMMSFGLKRNVGEKMDCRKAVYFCAYFAQYLWKGGLAIMTKVLFKINRFFEGKGKMKPIDSKDDELWTTTTTTTTNSGLSTTATTTNSELPTANFGMTTDVDDMNDMNDILERLNEYVGIRYSHG